MPLDPTRQRQARREERTYNVQNAQAEFMAISVIDFSAYSRGKGQSAAAKAAYDAGIKLVTETGQVADYRRKTGVIYSELLFAEGQKTVSRQEFWRTVEESEKRQNACLAKGAFFALPIELTRAQQIALAQDFAEQFRDRYNITAIDLAIHEPDQDHKKRKYNAKPNQNPHAHILFPDRDSNGKKLRQLNLGEGGREEIIKARQLFADITNKHLAAAGLTIRISEKKIEEQQKETNKELEKTKQEIERLEAELKLLDQEEEKVSEQSGIQTNVDVQRSGTDAKNLRRVGTAKNYDQKTTRRNGVLPNKYRSRIGQYQPDIREFIDNERSSGIRHSQQNRRSATQPRGAHRLPRRMEKPIPVAHQSKTKEIISNIRASLEKLKDWTDVISISTLTITRRIITKGKINSILKKMQKLKDYNDIIALGEKIDARANQHATTQHQRTRARTTPH